jgi:hypothetical protein
MEKGNKWKDLVLEEYKKGNVVVSNQGELMRTPLHEFIKQPTDGILYDLNRNEIVVLAFIEDHKWVNDFAVVKVIRALKARIEELESDIKE